VAGFLYGPTSTSDTVLFVMMPTPVFLQDILHFSAWRWCLFFSLFVPVYWTSRLVIHLLVMLVEARFLTKSRRVPVQ